MYFINSFLAYSIIGYIIEILCAFIIGAKNPESGFLYGPWTPIYGFAAILITLIYDKIFKKKNLPKSREMIILFFIITLLLMILEYIGGILMEIIFGFSFWNYKKFKFNIGKYTCLEMGLLWGIMGIIFIYIFRPFFDKYIKKTPKILTIIAASFFIIDAIIRLLIEYNLV